VKRSLFVVKRSTQKDYSESLEVIAENFATYLDRYYQPEKQSDSKHSKMGPIGKVLSKLRRHNDIEALKGELLRLHQMGSKKKELVYSGQQLIEEAFGKLKSILNESPLSKHSEIISKIDDRIYWKIENKKQKRIQQKFDRFISYLQNQFPEPEDMSRQVGTSYKDWNDLPYPRMNNKNAPEQVQVYIKNFLSQDKTKEESQ
jgi:hypothetical protein